MEWPTLSQIENWVTGGQLDQLTKNFEFAHKQQLFFLWQSGNFLVNAAAKLKEGHTQQQYNSFKKEVDVVKKTFLNWLSRQKEMQEAGAPVINIQGSDVFTKNGLQRIKNVLNTWTTDKIAGVGFIPVLIGIAVVAGIWGIYKISKQLSASVEDKEELMQQTKETCKEMNFTPDQCVKLIQDTQAQASSGTGLGDLLKYGIFAALGIAALSALPKHK